MAVRKARQRELGPSELQADAIEERNAPSPEERAVGSERIERAAEALKRCKPQEARALWLQAEGNSYDEIQEITGWTRTKVNRCLYEGRRAFLTRYAGIESGDECDRWAPLLSALVDGEATTEELLSLRPHLRNCGSCRSAVRELHRARAPLGMIFPASSALVLAGDQAEPAAQVFIRVYESVTSWLGERAASSAIRAQMLVEGVSGSAMKATAVAATAATVAGGGAAAIQHSSRAADAPTAAVVEAAAGPAAKRRATSSPAPAAGRASIPAMPAAASRAAARSSAKTATNGASRRRTARRTQAKRDRPAATPVRAAAISSPRTAPPASSAPARAAASSELGIE
jgi:hypothetical protein